MKKYKKINVRISLLFLVLLVIVAVVVGEIVYRISYSRSYQSTEKLLKICGQYVCDIIDAEHAKYWVDNGADEYYNTMEKQLGSIKNEFAITNLIVYVPLTNENGNFIGEAVNVFDLSDPAVQKNPCKLGEHVSLINNNELIRTLMLTGEAQFYRGYFSDGGAEQLVALVPMKLDTGEIYAAVELSYPVEIIKVSALRASMGLVLVFSLVIIVFAAILMIYMHHNIIRPVRLLSDGMNSFVKGGSEFEYKPVTEIRTGDEIEQMTNNFNSMAESIISNTRELKLATAQQEKMRAELDVAGSIRSAVSAESTYPAFAERSDFELFASLKNTVYNSCSFCNYFLTGSDHLFIVIGESVGKTLPSLLMSMLASESIRCLAGTGKEPYRIAADTNDQLCGFERSDKSMTVCALIIDIDLADGIMKYINAGMPPMLMKVAGEPYKAEEETIQFNLGEMRSVSFTQKTIQLQQGNTLILTSHGVSEMRNNAGEHFTGKRLESEINAIASEEYELKEIIGELESRLDNFRQERPTELDTTIIGFRYFG